MQVNEVSMPICEDSEDNSEVRADGFLCIVKYFDTPCLSCP